MHCNNSSPVANITTTLGEYETLRQTVYSIIIPSICGFGILGNSLNLIIFAYRLSRRCLDNLERSATVGLIALAISDLLFCVVVFPAAFLQHSPRGVTQSRLTTLAFYYSHYRGPLINLFLLTSTWLICLISLERFVVVCKPIRARWVIRVRKTVAIHTGICLLAVTLVIPEFVKFKVMKNDCGDCVCFGIAYYAPILNATFRTVYKALFTIFGTFLPLLILIACNVRLIIELYRCKAMGIADPARYCTPRITMVVVGIVVSYLILVCPSMVLEQLANTKLISTQDGQALARFRIAVVVANLMQSCKFACNFLLYCAVNKQFREHVSNLMRKSSVKHSSETTNRYNMVQLA
ncbi:hypothetical protein CAPTEDRAFT_224006 [Capitella teleta]|uniref:G-protein coupled receptors family 1 profile domain-containing protein n=1 Tax=Capitella teleta TaxID=283909 RepID=R7TNW7_CAPTE|nr:hypothetical protein CAPTEDRAFT_224006 [Capitella teleta]|eukprot:ELT95309.1 hypothetical protein CAPTEDRAFT_224006 [Capitella teleta]